MLIEDLTSKLKADQNVLAVALCSGESGSSPEGMPRQDILVLVSVMPFDLDMFGRKQMRSHGVDAILTYYRPDRLRIAIEDEAGCWLISGMVLYSKTVYDPNKILFGLRKLVNSIPDEVHKVVFERWLAEAKAFPSMVLSRMSVTKGSPREKLLGDQAPVARCLFLVNRNPPQNESSLLEDLMSLPTLPPGIKELFDIVDAFEVHDLRAFKRAQKSYAGTIAGIEDLARRA